MLEQVLARSRDHVAKVLGARSFAGRDQHFGRVERQLLLAGERHTLRYFRRLGEHAVWGRDSQLAYGFYLTSPRFSFRHEDFESFKPALAAFLAKTVTPDRPARFEFHLATPTEDGELALVFYEALSARQLVTSDRIFIGGL